jgi:hypothetical protein
MATGRLGSADLAAATNKYGLIKGRDHGKKSIRRTNRIT